MNGRRVLFWFVVVCVAIYVISNPQQAAGQIRGAFESGAEFLQALVG